jgi:hypothetical protein
VNGIIQECRPPSYRFTWGGFISIRTGASLDAGQTADIGGDPNDDHDVALQKSLLVCITLASAGAAASGGPRLHRHRRISGRKRVPHPHNLADLVDLTKFRF